MVLERNAMQTQRLYAICHASFLLAQNINESKDSSYGQHGSSHSMVYVINIQKFNEL